MKNAFEHKLKQSLEQASPEDVGHSFDRNKLWAKVAAKQQRKTVMFKPWLSHAAAVAIGLVLGLYLWSDNKETVTTPMAKMDYKQSPLKLPSAQTDKENLATASQGKNKIKPINNSLIEPRYNPNTASPGDAVKQVIKEAGQPEQPEVDVLEPLTLAVHKPLKNQKVLHLADMNNENGRKQMMQNTPGNALLAHLIDRQNHAEASQETVSAMVVNYLKKHN